MSQVTEVKSFKQSDLVLKVKQIYDPEKIDLALWMPYINSLCGDRDYQKEAIKNAVVYLASGNYSSLSELISENYASNQELHDKYATEEEFLKSVQLAEKLYATIDLATGTGKSYVIYGISQIMLGLGLVDRVLVLCPSLTIEAGLTEKFELLSGSANLKRLIPVTAVIKNPSIVNANSTVKIGDLCVENIHAVYETTGSSIADSFSGSGERVLVLNDEAHHIFNKVSGASVENASIKKWKSFLMSKDYGFHMMLGFTGTAYIDDDYFPDVIYRYSLRSAIEAGVVKNVDYVKEDDSSNDNERFQKIYLNHQANIDKYSLVKPLTILVTRDIGRAKVLYEDLVEFLVKRENRSKKEIEAKVLIVTSHKDHKVNVPKLKYVDNSDDPVEWIVSVSMLTEGWDVKNVFQIVPWEDKAFNSKLLVAQVLGRGLRIPDAYQHPQPRVIVFNHKSWSSKIKKLVDEVLEIETRIYSSVLLAGSRSKYQFTVKNINYSIDQKETNRNVESKPMDFSRLLTEGITLESQSVIVEKGTTYDAAFGGGSRQINYAIENVTYTIDEILDKLFDEFEQREWEGKALKLGEHEYTQNNLPPREDIRKVIELSMAKRGNKGEDVIAKNANKIWNAFAPLLRKKTKTVISQTKMGDTFEVSSTQMERQSTGVGNLRRGTAIFYNIEWATEITNPEQVAVMTALDEDMTLSRSALNPKNEYELKTPVDIVITSSEPERKFVETLCKYDVCRPITSWIKSRDRNFYAIEYSYRYGTRDSKTRSYFHGTFNPDFFIRFDKDGVVYYLVVEIKSDKDDSDENKAKYRFAVEHFKQLNERLEADGIKERYIFHFLSPEGYPTFFDYLKNGSVLEGQSKYRCELENLLEANDE